LVLGTGGAGKSRLSREMAEILNLPIIHLDRHYWNPGWVERERDD
jgi:adenylate kinase family enzyme